MSPILKGRNPRPGYMSRHIQPPVPVGRRYRRDHPYHPRSLPLHESTRPTHALSINPNDAERRPCPATTRDFSSRTAPPNWHRSRFARQWMSSSTGDRSRRGPDTHMMRGTPASASVPAQEPSMVFALPPRPAIPLNHVPSSGIPQPTQAYLRLAHEEPTELQTTLTPQQAQMLLRVFDMQEYPLNPRRPDLLSLFSPQPQLQALLVVFDLNGTLLYRANARSNPGASELRPGALRLLQCLACLPNVSLVVWSSAMPNNINTMMTRLINASKVNNSAGSRAGLALKNFVRVWSRNNFNLSPADYNRKTMCFKRLEILWNDVHIRRAGARLLPQGETWSQLNTVLVDDTVAKAVSEPYNLVCVPEYTGGPDPKLVLKQVWHYLVRLMHQRNVSSYIRAHPFCVS